MTDTQPAVNALLRDFEAKRQARYEAASAEHFADPDAEIPDAEWRTPAQGDTA